MALPDQPVINEVEQIPVPPLRTEAPADFTPKADTFLASWPKMVSQFNAAIGKFNALAVWVKTVANAALDAASAAATSANSAAGAVDAAAQQVGLAKNQADAAANSYTSMQTLAGALQSAAGLPPMQGKNGYFMQIGPDGVVRWWPLQKIGDVVTSMAPPDASWIPDNARYSQSLYPELFAKIGIQAVDDTTNLSKYAPTIMVGPSNNNLSQTAIGENGVVIHCSYSGYIFRSTDYGVTWNTSATAFSLGGKNGTCIAYDPLAKVFVASTSQGGCWRSTDQGVTWTFSALPGNWNGWSMFYIANAGRNTFVMTSTSDPSNIAVTTDGGVTWVLRAVPGSAKWVSWDGTYIYCSMSNNIYKSASLGTSWTTFQVSAPYTGGGQISGPITIGRVACNSKLLIFGITYNYQIGNTVYQHWGFYISYDNLVTVTWLPVSPPLSLNNNNINMNPGDMWLDQFGVALMAETLRGNTVWRVSGLGIAGKNPLVEQYVTQGATYASNAIVTDNLGFWVIGFGSSIKRVTPAYDPKTLFALPRIVVCEPPFNNYVKAKNV